MTASPEAGAQPGRASTDLVRHSPRAAEPSRGAVSDLALRFLAGDVGALARAITMVERGDPGAAELFDLLAARQVRSVPTVGLTGAPGAGKSTLVDAMTKTARQRGQTVGVLAVDPSSQISGGALLGDRLRLEDHLLDSGVFVRSMAARGQLGGLSRSTGEAMWLLRAFGFDRVLVETVGTGQSELDIATAVDTTVVVLAPGMGDEVQLEKAGIMEIADVFVVNKADLPGAESLAHELRLVVKAGRLVPWKAPVVLASAAQPDERIDALWKAVETHQLYLADDPAAQAKTMNFLRGAAAAYVADRARAWAVAEIDGQHSAVLERHRLPAAVGRQLCERLGLPASEEWPARGAA